VTETRPRRGRSDGDRTRRTILEAAAKLASVEGLDGLSIGRLADEVGMSKSGLYAHFRSKTELQLATIETADEIFHREVVAIAEAAPAGRERALALCEAFLSHLERGVFPGGCFFTAAASEMNVRPGRVRDRIATWAAAWLGTIQTAVAEAQERGELPPGADAAQVAFEANSLLVAANLSYLLFGDAGVLDMARRGVRDRLGVPA